MDSIFAHPQILDCYSMNLTLLAVQIHPTLLQLVRHWHTKFKTSDIQPPTRAITNRPPTLPVISTNKLPFCYFYLQTTLVQNPERRGIFHNFHVSSNNLDYMFLLSSFSFQTTTSSRTPSSPSSSLIKVKLYFLIIQRHLDGILFHGEIRYKQESSLSFSQQIQLAIYQRSRRGGTEGKIHNPVREMHGAEPATPIIEVAALCGSLRKGSYNRGLLRSGTSLSLSISISQCAWHSFFLSFVGDLGF